MLKLNLKLACRVERPFSWMSSRTAILCRVFNGLLFAVSRVFICVLWLCYFWWDRKRFKSFLNQAIAAKSGQIERQIHIQLWKLFSRMNKSSWKESHWINC